MYNPKDLKECYDIIEKGSHSFYAASKVLPKKLGTSYRFIFFAELLMTLLMKLVKK